MKVLVSRNWRGPVINKPMLALLQQVADRIFGSRWPRWQWWQWWPWCVETSFMRLINHLLWVRTETPMTCEHSFVWELESCNIFLFYWCNVLPCNFWLCACVISLAGCLYVILRVLFYDDFFLLFFFAGAIFFFLPCCVFSLAVCLYVIVCLLYVCLLYVCLFVQCDFSDSLYSIFFVVLWMCVISFECRFSSKLKGVCSVLVWVLSLMRGALICIVYLYLYFYESGFVLTAG